MLFKAPELLKIFFLGREISLDHTDLTSNTPSIRACVHQWFMQGVQILWPTSAWMGHSCVPLAQAAMRTASCAKALQQALPGISPMYLLPMVRRLHLSSGVVGLRCWWGPCPAARLLPTALELKALLLPDAWHSRVSDSNPPPAPGPDQATSTGCIFKTLRLYL